MQLEALECGAASLCMILAYYNKWIPLEQVRADCGVSRDGSNANNVLKAARFYGLTAKGYRCEPESLKENGTFPCIIHWNFNHFVVLDGFKGGKAYLNDPAKGAYSVSMKTFDESFTGICLMFEPSEAFEPSGKKKSVSGHLQVKKGFYYVVLSYYNNNGKRRVKYFSTGLPEKGNKRKAEAELARIRSEFVPPQEVGELASDMPFADYLLEWLDIVKVRVKATTFISYEQMVKSVIEPYFRKKAVTLQGLEARHIQQFYSEKLKTVKPNSVIHYHAVIHQALKYAMKTDLVAQNVAMKVDRPKKNDYQPVFLDAEELQHLFEVVKGTKLELPVLVAAFYGLRRGEVCGLKWDAIDFERGTITIRHTVTSLQVDGKTKMYAQNSAKTKSSMRTLPLVGSFAEYFKEVKAAQEVNKKVCGNCYNYEYDGYVFVDELGNLMRPEYLTSYFPQYIQKHGCKRMRFHDLRHSCASLLLANGVPLKHIQEWLGHSDFTTTANIYAHLDYSSKITSAQAMETGLTLPESGDFGSRWENGEIQI